jgi:hypothetical protein
MRHPRTPSVMVPAILISSAVVAAVGWRTCRRWHQVVGDAAGDREFDRTKAAAAPVEEAIALEDDPDLVVMAVAYHLGRLLDLDDVAWAWRPDRGDGATLEDDATIRRDGLRWPVERLGLPSCTRRALVCGPHHFGWIVMTARPSPPPVSLPVLYATLALCDQVATFLAAHSHPPIAHAD